MDNQAIEKICSIIKSNRSFSVYTHINADIDALGSSLVLKRALSKMGKTVHIFVDSIFPSNTVMFEDIDKINNEKQDAYDVCFVLDAPTEARLGRLKYKYRKNIKTLVCVDHHEDNEIPTKNKLVDINVSSTCELIYLIIKALKVDIDKEICKLLISGTYTDTGALQFSNTKSSTYLMLADLLNIYGSAIDEISMPLFNNLSKEAFNLKCLAYDRLELHGEDKIALISIKKEDFVRLKVRFGETKGLADIGMQIGSVKVVVLISESDVDEGAYHISIRTKGDYSAKNIAEEFGGGGHLKASGCKIRDSLENVRRSILEAAQREVNRLC